MRFDERKRAPAATEALLMGIGRTEAHIVAERFRGYDPYDALASPLFRVRGFRSNRFLRFGAQQALKRLPFNIRPLLGIRKGYNPVTLALVLQAYAYLGAAVPEEAERLRNASMFLVAELDRMQSHGYSGACWGYDFDWQTRFNELPAFTPTIVATGFVTNALFTAYELAGIEEALPLCVSAVDFVMNDLNRIAGPNGSFCWSYSPNDRQAVLNATAKGSRLCAQIYSITEQRDVLDAARCSLEFVVAHQLATGAWPYAIGDSRGWSDNFHTAYVLDSLSEYESRTDQQDFHTAAERGWRYYRDHFFEGDLVPRYFDRRTYPVDATACAQSMLTLCRYDDVATACNVAQWSLDHLQRTDGAFSYRIHRKFVNRIPYMRWSTAWMFCGLARVAMAAKRSEVC